MPRNVQPPLRGSSREKAIVGVHSYRGGPEMAATSYGQISDAALPGKGFDIMRMLNTMEELDPNTFAIPNFSPARFSVKKNGEVEAYAAITHEGLIRYTKKGLLFR